MKKIWFIEIEGKREGPYSVMDLKRDKRITPDTLAWRPGFENWVPIRNIPELKKIFEEEFEAEEEAEETRPIPADELTLLLEKEPPYLFFIWLVIVALIMFYVLYQLYGS